MNLGHRWLALTAAILTIGVLLRCLHLNSIPGLNPDEVEVALQWFRHPVIPWYVAPSGRPHLNPVGPILLWPFAVLANPAPWVVRMPAVIAGISVLPILFWTARRAFGQVTAIAATLLAAAAPILIAYSRLGWDPAYVPAVTTLVIGSAFAGRWRWAATFFALLVLVHPTAAFVLPLAGAPLARHLWTRAASSPQRRTRRAWIVAACLAVYGGLIAVATAGAAHVPLDAGAIPRAAALAGARLIDLHDMAAFIGGLQQTLTGGLIYTAFVGGPPVSVSLSTAGLVVALVVCSGVLLRWQGRLNELTLVVGLAGGLVAQYLSQGPDVAALFRERYTLWAAVPVCLVAAFVVRSVCVSYRIEKWAPAIAVGLAGIWLASFYDGYFVPLRARGGTSAVLDYRTSPTEPKRAVLDSILKNRRYAPAPAVVFVGEARLELGLVYLASGKADIQIKNLGAVLYPYYQRDDRVELLPLFAEWRTTPRDLFFVDYDWETLPGEVREVHFTNVASLADAVAPWSAQEVTRIRTADGQPLLRVWRLSRPDNP